MSNLVKIDPNMFAPVEIVAGQALTSFASASARDDVKSALAGIDSQGLFPSLSFKGGSWYVRQDNEQVPLMAPQGYASPQVHVVMAHVSPEVRKAFYNSSYDDTKREAPVCFSLDGQVPDASGSAIQASMCSRCPNNEFGSRVDGKGNKTGGKACSDHKHIICYVLDPKTGQYLLSEDGSPMLFEFRCAGGSFTNLRNYFKASLAQLNLTYYEVITTLSAVPGEQGIVSFALAARIAPAFVKYIETERASNAKIIEFVNQAKPSGKQIAPAQIAAPAETPALPAPKAASVAVPIAPLAAPATPAAPAKPALPKMPSMPGLPTAPAAKSAMPTIPAAAEQPAVKGIAATAAMPSKPRPAAVSVDPVGPAQVDMLADLDSFPDE